MTELHEWIFATLCGVVFGLIVATIMTYLETKDG